MADCSDYNHLGKFACEQCNEDDCPRDERTTENPDRKGEVVDDLAKGGGVKDGALKRRR